MKKIFLLLINFSVVTQCFDITFEDYKSLPINESQQMLSGLASLIVEDFETKFHEALPAFNALHKVPAHMLSLLIDNEIQKQTKAGKTIDDFLNDAHHKNAPTKITPDLLNIIAWRGAQSSYHQEKKLYTLTASYFLILSSQAHILDDQLRQPSRDTNLLHRLGHLVEHADYSHDATLCSNITALFKKIDYNPTDHQERPCKRPKLTFTLTKEDCAHQ